MRRSHPVRVLSWAFLLSALGWVVHPWVLTRWVNARLAGIPGYRSSVDHARLLLLPPGLVVKGFRMDKRAEIAPACFLSLSSGALEASPLALLQGRLSLRITLEGPSARFLMRQRRPGQARKFALWQPVFSKLPAFRVTRLTIADGWLRLQNAEDIPPLDLFFDGITGAVENLANRPGLLRKPPRLEGRARMMGQAPMTLVVETKPFQERVDFHLKGEVKGFDLATLNPVLRHYTGVDLEAGALDVAGDLTASGGNFHGTVRRTLAGVKVIGRRERHGGLAPLLKEMLVQAWLNRRKDGGGDIAAEYALSGPLGYMNADVFLASVWAAKSAFLQSLRPAVPPEIVMGSPEQAEEEWMALQARERMKAERAANGSVGK